MKRKMRIQHKSSTVRGRGSRKREQTLKLQALGKGTRQYSGEEGIL
jgi:hypothetical protein